MRQVTQNAVNAFIAGNAGTFSNTTILVENETIKMYLHGNLIAKKENNRLFITNAGWQSNTTKERLNGLPGVSIQQKNFNWYLNGEEWNGKLTEVK